MHPTWPDGGHPIQGSKWSMFLTCRFMVLLRKVINIFETWIICASLYRSINQEMSLQHPSRFIDQSFNHLSDNNSAKRGSTPNCNIQYVKLKRDKELIEIEPPFVLPPEPRFNFDGIVPIRTYLSQITDLDSQLGSARNPSRGLIFDLLLACSLTGTFRSSSSLVWGCVSSNQ